MSIATDKARLEGAKTSLANWLTGKGVTVPASTKLDGLVDLLQNVPSSGGVQRYNGSFTTNSSGVATINCGFKPDLLVFDFGTYSYGVDSFHSNLAVPCYLNDQAYIESYNFSDNTGISNANFVGVSCFGFTNTGCQIAVVAIGANYAPTNIANKTLTYTAIKFS